MAKKKSSKTRPMLISYVVYKHPSDYPDNYVLRRFVNTTPDLDCQVCDTLEEIHKALPLNLFNCGPDDLDPVIIEVWI